MYNMSSTENEWWDSDYIKKKYTFQLNKNDSTSAIHLDLKKAYDSVRKEILHNILTEFEVQLVRLIKICLNETHNKVCISKNLSETFHVKNYVKQGDA
jgi:hypothetical protein